MLADEVQALQVGVFAGQLVHIGIARAGIDVAWLFTGENGCTGGYVGKAKGRGLEDGGDMGMVGIVPFHVVVDDGADAGFGRKSFHGVIL